MPESTKEEIIDKYSIGTTAGQTEFYYEKLLIAMDEYTIHVLESLLKTNSTQAYWPAIIKEKIKQLKGE